MSQQDNSATPMEIDPVDDGPKQVSSMAMGPFHASSVQGQMQPQSSGQMAITQEEEARQAIEMLRGDDVSERVAAANRLEAVAAALGEERTREVCSSSFGLGSRCGLFVHSTAVSHPFFYR